MQTPTATKESRYIQFVRFALSRELPLSVQDVDAVTDYRGNFYCNESLDFDTVKKALGQTDYAHVFVGKKDEVLACAGINIYADDMEPHGGLIELEATDIGETFVRDFLATQIDVKNTDPIKAYEHLVRRALELGCVVSVFDGEEWAVKLGQDYPEIIDAIESVEEAELAIRDAQTDEKGKHPLKAWALVSPFGLAPDETVIDSSANDWMKENDEDYELANTLREQELCKATFTESFVSKFHPSLTECYSLGTDEVERCMWTVERNGEAIYNPFRSECGRFVAEPSYYSMTVSDADVLLKANEAIVGCQL